MKIAIINYGLARNYKKTGNKLVEILDENPNNEYHIYNCFWDITKDRDDVSDNFNYKTVDINDLNNTYGVYLYKYKVLNSKLWGEFYNMSGEIRKKIGDHNSIHMINDEGRKNFIKNSIISQFYCMRESVKLIDQDQDYDYLIVMRFDIEHHGNELFNYLNINDTIIMDMVRVIHRYKNEKYHDTISYNCDHLGFSSGVFFGKKDNIVKICSVYDVIEQNLYDKLDGDLNIPEKFVYAWALYNSIQFTKLYGVIKYTLDKKIKNETT